MLLSAAVLLLLFAAVAALLCDLRLFFFFAFRFCACFSFRPVFFFFGARVASVRCDVFVWQEGECLFNMAQHFLLGPLLPSPILKEGGNPAPVRLRSFIIYRRPVNVRTHNCYNGPSVPFFP